MYENVCKLFGQDPNIGLDWDSLKKLFEQSGGGSSQSPASPRAKPKPALSPAPSNQSFGNPTQKIEDAFLLSDKDEDGYLNEKEFGFFVKRGFNKTPPKSMYKQVCAMYNIDKNIGINWVTAFKLWKQSNPQYNDIPDPGPPKKGKPSFNKLEQPKQLISSKSFDNSKSVNNNNKYIIHKKENSLSIKSNQEIINDNMSDSSEYQNTKHKKNMSSAIELKRAKTLKNIELMDEEDDASTIVVQMMEKKLKDKHNQYKIEKAKRIRFEERTSQLLIENEKYKEKLSEIQQQNNKFNKQINILNEQNNKYKNQVEDDSKTIKHLQTQKGIIHRSR